MAVRDKRGIAAAAEENHDQRPVKGNRPGQNPASPSGSERAPERGEEKTERRERPRPETLPPSTTSGGLPSEPGWMR